MSNSRTDIQTLLIALERPSCDEQIASLNLTLGKYLDTVTQPLNMSFWETVRYDWWTYLNLAKLCDKTYDVNSDDFVSKIRVILRKRIQASPHVRAPRTYVAPAPVAHVVVDTPVTADTSIPESTENDKLQIYTPPVDNIPDETQTPWYNSTPVKILTLGLGLGFIASIFRWGRGTSKEHVN